MSASNIRQRSTRSHRSGQQAGRWATLAPMYGVQFNGIVPLAEPYPFRGGQGWSRSIDEALQP